MHAVVRGEASCVIVRNVLTPTQATAALHRLYERELISPVDGRAGHAALAYPFRRHAGAVETGVTLQVPCAASTPLPTLIDATFPRPDLLTVEIWRAGIRRPYPQL